MVNNSGHTEWCRSQWKFNAGPCDCGYDGSGGVREPRVKPKSPSPISVKISHDRELTLV